jgi:hypothetical protein
MIAALKRDSKQASTRSNGKQPTRDRTSDAGRYRPEDDALSRRSPDDLADRPQDMRISRTNPRDRQHDTQESRYTSVRQVTCPLGLFRVNERLRLPGRPIVHTGWM